MRKSLLASMAVAKTPQSGTWLINFFVMFRVYYAASINWRLMKIIRICLRFTYYLAVCSAIALVMPAEYVSAQTCTPAPPQAVSWWPGDGDTTDVIGGHGGTLAGSAAFGAGKVNKAFNFNGSGWVDIPDSSVWTLGAHDFTIELWAKFNSLTGLDPLVAHTDGGGPQNKWIFWYNSTGHDRLQGTPALRFMLDNISGIAVPHDIVVAPWNPATGQWYHLAVTRSGDTYRLYIDGSLVATDTSSEELPDPSVPLTIGRAEAFKLNGAIDEPAFYRRALTTQEISQIFDASSAGKCKPTIPIPEYGLAGGIAAATVGIGVIAFARKRVQSYD